MPGRLTPYLCFLVLLLSAAGFIDSFATSFRYRMSTYVRQDFQIEMSVMVGLFTWMYLGSVLSFVPRVLADIFGRKVVLWSTMAGLCVLQWAVGFARTPAEYALALSALAIFYKSDTWMLVMAEEAPPRHRGAVMAIMATLAALGAFTLGELVKRMGPEADAWRSVTQFPIYGLILVIPILLFTRETRHFQDLKARGERRFDWSLLWAPFRRPYIRTLAVVSLLRMVLAGGVLVVISITETEFLRVDQGFNQEIVGTLIQWDMIATVLGWLVAGFVSDRIGRRTSSLILALLYAFSLLCFALLPRGSIGVMVFSVIHNFAMVGVFVLLRISALELFPTSFRSTASAWVDLFTVLCAAATSRVLSWLLAGAGNTDTGLPLTAVIIGCAVIVLATLPLYQLMPETVGRRLEEA